MGFKQCHPAINLIYFISVIYGMISFEHPVFLAISFLSAIIYSIKRNGKKALVFNLALLPFIIIFALYYSSYTHFGITILKKNFIGNNITMESLIYGVVLGVIVAGVMIWLSCIYSVFSSDKVVYLFGRISPKLSLFLAILLRLIPRIKLEAKSLNMAQCGIGRGVSQGNVFMRLKNCIRIFSMLITWTIEAMTTASESMQSRGSSLRGRKAFSIYRFDNRDRMYVIVMSVFLTITFMGVLLGQMESIYDPRIIIPPATAMSWLFYFSYAALCLMPLFLELWTEYTFKKNRRLVSYNIE